MSNTQNCNPGILDLPAQHQSTPRYNFGGVGRTLPVIAVLIWAASALAADTTKVRISQVTGMANFIAGDNGAAIAIQPAGNRAVAATTSPFAIINQFGDQFGIIDASTQLRQIKVETDMLGHVHTSFQQVHNGVDVFSGILRVHQNARGEMTAMNGDFYPVSSKVDTIPVISADDAFNACIQELKLDDADIESLSLVIVDPGWYGDHVIGERLGYHVVVTSTTAVVREAFFIDANNGEILDQWSMLHSAQQREIHDGQGMQTVPGVPVRSEGDPAVVSPEDANRVYDFFGDVYTYYFNAFGRDSIDGNGEAMIATVNSTRTPCPNATWTGSQMLFCAGSVTDDIVGHEMTHGVTERTANLVYQNQAGQLNESFSDVFGELIDLYNGGAEVAGATGPSPFGDHPTGPGLDGPNNLRTTTCSVPPAFEVTSPASIAGSYIANSARFGPPLTQDGVSGEIVIADSSLGCNADMPFVNELDLAGKIVFMDAGFCSPYEKVLNAENAGAIGVIMVFNIPGLDPVELTPRAPGISIPSLMISFEDGALIRDEVAMGNAMGTLKSYAYAEGVRWLQSEDAVAFGGAIRDMWNPTCKEHPDHANSAFQTCSALDSGGVHSGSGVPNHAFTMLTDGKDYNGYSVSGIGAMKSGAVWYRALTVYLTPASDFDEAFAAFNQSATDLIGFDLNDPRTGLPSGDIFTAADALEVEKALLAVGMNTSSICGESDIVLSDVEPQQCGDRQTIYSNDFESDASGWTVFNSGPVDPFDWILTNDTLPNAVQGTAFFIFNPEEFNCDGPDRTGQHSLTSPVVVFPIDTTQPRVSFKHIMLSEGAGDGGNLKINVNGGGWQVLPRTSYTYNAANAVINSAAQNSTNPMGGETGWTGWGGLWGRSIADLSSFVAAGDSVVFRFDFGQDDCRGVEGWYVDEFEVYNCPDCDDDGTVDIDQSRFAYVSEFRTGIGFGSEQVFVIPTPPTAASDVIIKVHGRGDFGRDNEMIDVDVNGTIFATLFQLHGAECGRVPDSESFVISAVDFNPAVAGVDATVSFMPTVFVSANQTGGACQGETYISFSMEYDLDAADCDGDGVLDICSQQATIEDFVAALLNPTPASCVFDSNGDGSVNGLDVQGFVTDLTTP